MENWYHGSSTRLTELRVGSTITKQYNLACIFSHKPSIVSIDDEGIIKHNGWENGLLYIVDETIDLEHDVEPHPRSAMVERMEWLTQRTLKIKLLEETGQPNIDDLLTTEEINVLRELK
ncbi:hypothetical protein [Paenibacillus sp. CGMCC 1.18879]|uniref:hypothetical protein n=1 Tax=Paenibacillus sp. CGMCC 1.18879 TaxID=2834466 RepID=UPI001CA9AE13|nr:hypothetical protein [Paenibacillus sp. CGMCC 1.18879]MBY9079723.1 hypothetical protein [Paenibacillus sp. CGMCC 1.18879]